MHSRAKRRSLGCAWSITQTRLWRTHIRECASNPRTPLPIAKLPLRVPTGSVLSADRLFQALQNGSVSTALTYQTIKQRNSYTYTSSPLCFNRYERLGSHQLADLVQVRQDLGSERPRWAIATVAPFHWHLLKAVVLR